MAWPTVLGVGGDALAAARSALDRGDVLIAYDEAVRVVDADPDDLAARYLAVLALARSGAAARAAREARVLRELVERSPGAPRRLREDVAALDARIAKQRALAVPADAGPALALDAAMRYESVADEHGGYYACINAATLHLLAGDVERSQVLARRALSLVAATEVERAELDPDAAYWAAATSAEASLLLDETAAARRALQLAARLPQASLAARATTRRQLELVCSARGADPSLLDELQLPGVVHYCGHVAGGSSGSQRFRPEHEAEVRARVAAYLAERNIGIAFGSLASGADLVIAEAVLERGAELNVVLPFDTEEFVQVSVRPGGEQWATRFRACLARASSVVSTCDSAYLGDDALFAYASRIAMGHARNRAAALAVEPQQLAVWDGSPARGAGGTAEDIAIWREAGGSGFIVDLPAAPTRSDATVPAAPARGPRSLQAILFADFRGFSRLHDEQYAVTIDTVFTPLAGVLSSYGTAVRWLNSWGDAIQVVFSDVVSAGRCALELQEVNAALDRAAASLPGDLDLRIGLHVGPILKLRDPFRSQVGWWGREMTRAARIEPRTPEGEVYATDAFAALVALEPGSALASEYVGRVTTAKDFETIPMYRIRRA